MTDFKLGREGLVVAAVFLVALTALLSDLRFERGWMLVSVDRTAVAPHRLDIVFTRPKGRGARADLRTPCASYTLRYERFFGRITVSQLHGLKTECRAADQDLMAVLTQADRYRFTRGRRLVLTTPAGRTLAFRRGAGPSITAN